MLAGLLETNRIRRSGIELSGVELNTERADGQALAQTYARSGFEGVLMSMLESEEREISSSGGEDSSSSCIML